jgi:hypothetical protein
MVKGLKMAKDFNQGEDTLKIIPPRFFESPRSDFSEISFDLTGLEEIYPMMHTSFANFCGLPEKMPYLKQINIAGEFESLSGLPLSLPALTSFVLITLKVLQDLQGFPQYAPKLKRLDIRGEYYSFKGLPDSLPSLEELWLDCFCGKNFIGFPQHVQSLRKIDTSEWAGVDYPIPLESLSGFPSEVPSLEFLAIVRTKIEDLYYFPITTPKLTTIHLYENRIRSLEGFPQLIEPVTGISLNQNQLTSLNGLPHLPMIEYLNFGDNCIQSLAGLAQEYQHLDSLQLYRNQISSLECFPQRLPQLKTLFLHENRLERFEGLPDYLPSLELFTIEGNPIRTLSFLSLGQIKVLLNRRENFEQLNLSPKGVEIANSGDVDAIFDFYRRTPGELANSLINGENLSQDEQDRLVYEANYADLGILRRKLDDSHPVVKAICARIGDFPADIVQKLANDENIRPDELEHPALPQYAAFLIDYCQRNGSANAKAVIDFIKRRGFPEYAPPGGRWSLPNLLL